MSQCVVVRRLERLSCPQQKFMCFRLLVTAGSTWLPEDIERHGARSGLDVRARNLDNRLFASVAWGDCACSLYTGREGRERLLRFIEGLAADRVQLLLYRDGDLPDWENPSPTALKWEDLRTQGLAALPERLVTELRLGPAGSCLGLSPRKP